MLVRNLLSLQFGRLTAIERVENNKYGQSRWKCLCICGNKHVVTGFLLTQGQVKSCGCLHIEKSKENLKIAHLKWNLPKGIAARNRMFNRYKGQANFRNLPFELTIEQFEKLAKGNCHYCGVEPLTPYTSSGGISPNGHYYANGIDRIDNKKGYIIGNCVSCCRICNYAKRGMSHELFIAWIKRITKYQQAIAIQ